MCAASMPPPKMATNRCRRPVEVLGSVVIRQSVAAVCEVAVVSEMRD